ncbi:MAG TPA: DUF1772 domain-containing protein [Reyranella sp.]|nr:DUF1772 domain-containing protein [Reyranella sp.]
MQLALLALSIVLAAVGMGLSLAHALELPGKRRLDREHYLAVQTIYVPGFGIGGFFGEGLAIAATLVLTILTPTGTTGFWLTLAALGCLLVEHGIFWFVTQPVNRFWGKPLPPDSDWKALRDRWEASHVARAVFAALAFLLLLTVAIGRPLHME